LLKERGGNRHQKEAEGRFSQPHSLLSITAVLKHLQPRCIPSFCQPYQHLVSNIVDHADAIDVASIHDRRIDTTAEAKKGLVVGW